MQIGHNSRFLTEMLTNLQSDMIMLEMSLPNRNLNSVDGLGR
jgi:DNA polymerase-3 subunit beta